MTSTTTEAKVYKPRNHEFSDIDFTRPSVFLAGSIEMNKAVRWQAAMEEKLQHLPINILNPRRDKWEADLTQRKSNPEFAYQVTWELDCQEKADLIAMYLQPGTNSPISLLELGLFANEKKLIVCCPVDFYRRGNVEIVAERHGVTLIDTYEEFVQRIIQELEEKVKAKEAAPIQA